MKNRSTDNTMNTPTCQSRCKCTAKATVCSNNATWHKLNHLVAYKRAQWPFLLRQDYVGAHFLPAQHVLELKLWERGLLVPPIRSESTLFNQSEKKPKLWSTLFWDNPCIRVNILANQFVNINHPTFMVHCLGFSGSTQTKQEIESYHICS